MDHIVSSDHDLAPSASHPYDHNVHAPGLSARLALNKATRKQAYELRHAGYLMAGYINGRAPGGILRDEYDESAAAQTIVLYKGDVPAASVRVCLLDPAAQNPDTATVPASEIFQTEIDELLGMAGSPARPARAMEITKLARHPDFTKNNDLVFGLFRMTGYLILHHDVDLVLITVCAHHVPFYKRLGYEAVGAPRDYPDPKFNVVVGLMVCRKTRFQDVCSNFPIMAGISRSDGIYERFMQGESVPVILPQKARETSPPPASATPRFVKPIVHPEHSRDLVAAG